MWASYKNNRLVVGLALGVLFFPVIYLEIAWLWDILLLICIVLAAYEWGRLLDFNFLDRLIYTGSALCLMAFTEFLFNELAMLWYVGLVCLFWAFIVPWWLLMGWTGSSRLRATVGLLLLNATWLSASFLFVDDIFLLLVGLLVVCGYDISAFVVGKAIGRTPLASTISPKKTIEGLLGGIVIVCFTGFLYCYFFQQDKSITPIVLSVLLAGVVLATVGDLFESYLKRQSGVKDSSGLLGGHGGVLDRLDAIMPTLPFVVLLSEWFI